jgi:hypothetical protein
MLPHTKTYSLAVFLTATVFLFPGHEPELYGSSTGNEDLLPVKDVPGRRAHHALVYDGYRKTIMMTAGSTPLEGGRSFQFYNDLWSFDGSSWTMTGRAGDERSGIGLAFDSKRKKIYSFGGFAGNRSLDDLRVLEEGNWKTLAHLPEMTAAEPGLVYDAGRDRLVVFGGSSGRGQVNGHTWEWDGSSWKQFSGEGPGGRQAFAMVYDAKLGRTIIFGGMGTTPEQVFGDTWTFDGKKWEKLGVVGPGERMSTGFAYDSKRGRMIIFGGMQAGKMMNDTWAFDSNSWKLLASDGPPARAMGFMAYDEQRDRLVLFGGRKGWPNDLSDTWEFDGTRWKEANPGE